MDYFVGYDWPGNIRELANLTQRLTVLCEEQVTLADLPGSMLAKNSFQESPHTRPSPAELVVRDVESEDMNFNQTIADLEVSLITTALRRSGGNRKQAADILGLNRTTLIEKIKRHNLNIKTSVPKTKAA